MKILKTKDGTLLNTDHIVLLYATNYPNIIAEMDNGNSYEVATFMERKDAEKELRHIERWLGQRIMAYDGRLITERSYDVGERIERREQEG